MNKLLLSYWPIFLLFSLWFLFGSPYFFKDKVPYPSTYQVNFFAPWSHYQKFLGPVKNNAMPDVIDQIYPWKHFTVQTFRMGQIPLWNPNSFAGNPHLANYQSAVISPFNFLYFVFSFIDAWSIIVLLQPLLAGIFTYLFIRTLSVSKIGSLVGSIAFMFCGFIVVWMAYGTLSMAIAFLPLSLFTIEKYYQRGSLKFLFLLSISIPFSFFSGHFQTSIYFLFTIILYILYKAVIYRKTEIKKIIYVIFALCFGFVLCLPQFIPSIEFYNNSVRSGIFITGGGIPFSYLITLVAPDFFGNPVTRNDWLGSYAEWSSFVGVVPVILVLFAFYAKKKGSTLFFFMLTLIVSILAIDSPIQKIIASLRLPVISTSAPNRIIVLLSFSLAVLAGVGLDSLKELLKKKSTKELAMPLSILGLLFIFIWVLLLSGKLFSPEHVVIAKRNLILPTILFAGGTLLIFVSMFTKWKALLLLTTYYLLLTTSFDSFHFAQKWMPFDPRDLVFPNSSVISAMQKNIGDGRVFGNLGAFIDTYYNLPSVEGYDPLYIDRYGQFIRTAATGDFTESERSVVKLARNGKYTNRALDLLGVSLIFNPIPDTNQGWAYPVWEDKKRNVLIYKDDKFELYKNMQALPRATLFYKTEVVADSKKLLKRFYTDSFDFRNILLLEDSPNVSLQGGTGSAEITRYTPNVVDISVNTSVEAFLFLSDNYYPGWVAKVSGKKEKIYRADYTFRAVVVPGGKSKVEFTYENWHF